MFCIYCHQPCGDSGFCDDTCYEEYRSEMNAIEGAVREDEPQQQPFPLPLDQEPEDWDEVAF
jgi:hypothetical protein